MRTKIQTVLQQLNHGLVEREEVLKTTLLAVLAGENSVLIGPPGTGKSLMARRIAESFAPVAGEGAGQDLAPSYFEYLLTKFSTPEEIFGPLSISELKNDRFKRNTAGYLPSVEFAFLDEIFKASSSILNSLLTILNERLYHNGATAEPTPLHALIAASNELPADQDELGALYDRFLVRSFVDYVGENNLHLLFASPQAISGEVQKLNVNELATLHQAAASVTLPPNIIEAIKEIWRQHKELFKEDRRESLSDRRLKKIIHLLRVAAATNRRREVDLSDVILLKNCLWNHPDNAIKVRDLILNTLQRFSSPVPANSKHLPVLAEKKLETYIVAADGINLIPDPFSSPFPSTASRSQKVVVKGFKGSGTEYDPLLVQSMDDLMDLARPEVGQKGYFFRQTADIDCSSITTWPEITFQGQYDGAGFTIKKDKEAKCLFTSLQSSKVRQMKLVNLVLAGTANGSEITQCTTSNCSMVGTANDCTFFACNSGYVLIGNATRCAITSCRSADSLIGGNATHCTITACQSADALIWEKATDCTIKCCQAGHFLIREVADKCKISDCLVLGNYTDSKNETRGGIAHTLQNNCVVERCFIRGQYNRSSGYFNFSGIASQIKNSVVRQCGIGLLQSNNSSSVSLCRLSQNAPESSTLENNASIDTNPIWDSHNKSLEMVAAARFKQRYFELTLGWDFDKVWVWNDKEDRPALREVGVNAQGQTAAQPSHTTAPQQDMVDLLTQQIQANIWL